MSIQFSFSKTRFFGTLQKLISILLCHFLEQSPYMSVKLPSVHLLFWHFFAFLLFVIVFGAFISPVSSPPASETLSFFQELVSLFNRQSVDVHRIRVSFPSWEIKFLLWGFVFPTRRSLGSFYGLIDLGMFVIQLSCPLVPVVNGLEWCL
jgi:hypothetical protein